MVFQLSDQEKLVREKTRAAVNQAMESRWEEAVVTNRELLGVDPTDVEASNRLGRAHVELGQLTEATVAFKRSLDASPDNAIARKNLDRLTAQGTSGGVVRSNGTRTYGLTPALFIADSGKSTTVTLTPAGEVPNCQHLASGAGVEVRDVNDRLLVYDAFGQPLGSVPPKIGARMARLMAGGNRYDGAIVSVVGGQITVLLRELHQHPSMRNLVSFPSNEGASFSHSEAGPEAQAADGVDADQDLDDAPMAGELIDSDVVLTSAVDDEDESFPLVSGEDEPGSIRAPDSLDSAVDAELEDDDADEAT